MPAMTAPVRRYTAEEIEAEAAEYDRRAEAECRMPEEWAADLSAMFRRRAAMLRQAAADSGWYRAIDEASVCWEMAVEPTDDPKVALNNLICREQDAALDPRVSPGARDLVRQAAADGQGWRDIATAPKDGTWVLIHSAHWTLPEIAQWSWLNNCWQPMDDGFIPTHWQPLPAAPTATPTEPTPPLTKGIFASLCPSCGAQRAAAIADGTGEAERAAERWRNAGRFVVLLDVANLGPHADDCEWV